MTTLDFTKPGQVGEPTEPAAPAASDTTPAPVKPAGELQPLLVGWLTDRREFVDTVRKAAQRGGHRALWHLLRLPLYIVRLGGYSPRGLWRIARAVYGVLSDGQGHALRVEAATGSDAATWLKLRKERNERVHRRLVVAGVLAAPVVLLVLAAVSTNALGVILGGLLGLFALRVLGDITGFLLCLAAPVAGWFVMPLAVPDIPSPPMWLWCSAAFLAVMGLGWNGRPLGKPLVKPATVLAGNHGPLRAPFVMEALCSIGIAGLNDKTMDQIGLLFDVARVGPGYQVDLQLPRGVAATSIIEKREKLSAALRRHLGTVWPSVGELHEGHLRLYVCDQPMTESKQAPWPLLKDGQVDLFKPQPMFTDQRSRWVDLTIAYSNGVIGAVPRMGKTFALRQLLLVSGLDPRSKVHAIDGKGTGDLSPCSLFAHNYGVGDEPEDIEDQLEAMRALRVELRRRARVIRGLPREECPESKVTSVLANRRELGLEPIVVGVDETQVWFEYGDKTNKDHKAIREEFASIVTDLVKRGPALGIWVFLATQNVTSSTIPTAISSNAVIRFCLKVFGHIANDQILGTGARAAGIDASMFSPNDKGIGYLRADGTTPSIVRTVAGLDAVASEKVALRARSIRAAAGRLTGQATDETLEEEAVQVDLLADVREVFDRHPRGAVQVTHLRDIVDGLALLRPKLYGHLDAAALGAQLRTAGVETGSVHVRDKGSQKGTRRAWLDVSTTAQVGNEDPGEGNVRELRPGQSLTGESDAQSEA